MKITRSYLLGVGSGLMLSVLFAISLSALGLQNFSQLNNLFSFSKHTSPSTAKPSNQNQPTTQQNSDNQPAKTLTEVTKDPKATNTPPPKDPATIAGTTQPIEKQFVIPDGVSSERIAELLVGQGFVTDKAKFLETVEKLGVAGKFRPGTYNLILGLNHDEIVNRLIGSR